MCVGANRFVCRPATAVAILVAGFAATDAGAQKPGVPGRQESITVTNATQHRHTNRLIHATSPYLLQHAHNPVDWHEWGEEAFAKAKKEDKPIFLSIGYAACHWCHVMEHESFEVEAVADVLNRGFVAVKVDREERPDIDELYMAYTQQATGHGGWPMSVWLTPDGTPFHAGTYFPREHFVQILTAITKAWGEDRDRITAGADSAKEFFAAWSASPAAAEGVIGRETVDGAAGHIARYYDKTHGGVSGGGTNKFPPSMGMDLMLRVYARTGANDLFEAADITLDHMARGGIYDHIGGGICRYSTDVEWLVPHFEKMLYDQAMVSSIYLDAFQVTRNEAYAAVAADIFDYVIEDLQSPEGGFYSSRDADSEGLEGAFYVWTVEQVSEVLGEDDAKLFCEFYDVTPTGNWFENRGHAPAGPKNVLQITTPVAPFCNKRGLDLTEFKARLRGWREKMRTARAKRVAPGLDDKILTGWNGLMIASLAKGARVLDEPKYAEAAQRAASFLLAKLRKEGRLLRTYRKGEARLTGYLSDYAFLIEGLINLYEATFEQRWLDEAVLLTDAVVKHYRDDKGGAFFFTAADAETLVARSKNPRDGAIPSGNSVLALDFLRLAVLFDRKDYRAHAEGILRGFSEQASQIPGAFERLLCAADFYHDRVKEIAIIGDPAASDTKALLDTVYARYLPNKVVVLAADPAGETHMPLLKGKGRKDGKATAYVCEHYNCKLPVTEPDGLARQLDTK